MAKDSFARIRDLAQTFSYVLEVLSSVAINWPSPDGRLDRNSGYQINDIKYMDIDDYD